MRDLTELDRYRLRGADVAAAYGWDGDGSCGAFRFRSPVDGRPLIVIASSGERWDHVSVSRQGRCPNWDEMEWIARQFFRADEVAMQLHAPASDHVNVHKHCLHWWRPHDQPIPRPPALFV